MVPENSSISQSDTFMASRDILRVGGRLTYQNLVGEENHLVIISKKFAFSNMIIQCSHHSFPHVRR